MDAVPQITQGYDSLISVNEILWEQDIESSGTVLLPDPVRGEIEFRHVSFRYSPDQEPVLKDVSFHVPAGGSAAFVGKSGDGKSTILNLLAEKERAIVTSVAGTTRDVISETVAAGNVTLRLSDTAGVHGTDDLVESIGVQRSIEALEEAELILAVFDLSRGLDEEDEEILSHVAKRADLGIPVIAICNKSDLFDAEKSENDAKKIAQTLGTEPILLCAKNEDSRKALVSLIENIFESSDISATDNAVITNARQFAAVNEALTHAKSALFSLDYLGEDTACAELELAMGKLGELDGRQVTIDIVDSIFHRFCVGK
jgi:tRNA modification GTPase